MKALLFPVIVAGLVSSLLAAPLHAGSYAQLSSTESQMAGTAGKLITLNQTDSSKEIENNKGIVTIKEAGVYFVMAAGQVGGPSGKGKGTVRPPNKQSPGSTPQCSFAKA